MPTDVKVLAGILALCVSYDIGRHSLKKKLKRTINVAAEMLTNQMELNQDLHGELSYLCHVLNERGIDLDEFDLIALPHVHVTEVQK